MTTELEKTTREIWDILNPNDPIPPTPNELYQVELWAERAEIFITLAQKQLADFIRK